MDTRKSVKRFLQIFDRTDVILVKPTSARVTIAEARKHFKFEKREPGQNARAAVFEGFCSLEQLNEFAAEGLIDSKMPSYHLYDELYILPDEPDESFQKASATQTIAVATKPEKGAR